MASQESLTQLKANQPPCPGASDMVTEYLLVLNGRRETLLVIITQCSVCPRPRRS